MGLQLDMSLQPCQQKSESNQQEQFQVLFGGTHPSSKYIGDTLLAQVPEGSFGNKHRQMLGPLYEYSLVCLQRHTAQL